MAFVIAEPCIGIKDKACIDVCPMDCIHGGDQDPMLYIDPEECIDCDGCVPVCPVEAIFPAEKIPAKWQHYVEINANYFKGRR
jgi:NAD-dependent dihydropyrimidine dehydrogenase PreA subunit